MVGKTLIEATNIERLRPYPYVDEVPAIFFPDQLEKAEAIVKILDGMTVASASRLLNSVDRYLREAIFTQS